MKKIEALTEITQSESFPAEAVALYGDAEGQMERYCALFTAHEARFPLKDGGLFFSSPGRIEVIGNHTDHNHGKVLTAAVSVDTLAFVTATDDGIVTVVSEGFDEFSCDVSDLTQRDEEKVTSVALIRGIAKYFIDKGYSVGGFNATVTSRVPKGAGVSSSASFELMVAEVFNVLYNGGRLNAITKAMASQYAENVYFGKPCGLMDQSAIALGGVSMIDFGNAEAPDAVSLDWPFTKADIVITNTGGSHDDLTAAYASIRDDMEAVANYFKEKALRQVDYDRFMNEIPVLRKKFSGRALLRAFHFYDENNRVDKAVSAINMASLDAFLKCVDDSGSSSWRYLQNCYVAGDLTQRIPLALAVSERIEGVLASRIHGGGFEGTIIAFTEKGNTAFYIKEMADVFGEENVVKLSIRKKGACCVKVL